MMTQRRLVLGYFETVAEAQQAVQELLAGGFTEETVKLLRLASLKTPSAGEQLPPLTESGSRSGRFFSSLFGSRTERRFHNAALVSVQTQSTAEAKQVTDLLAKAGASGEDEEAFS